MNETEQSELLAEMTGAAGTMTVGGRLLTLSKPEGEDYGMLQAFIAERIPNPFSRVREALASLDPGPAPAPPQPLPVGKSTPPDDIKRWEEQNRRWGERHTRWRQEREDYEYARTELLKAAHADLKAGPTDRHAAAAVLKSLDGVSYSLWLFVRRNHPDVSFEWLRDALKHEDLEKVASRLTVKTSPAPSVEAEMRLDASIKEAARRPFDPEANLDLTPVEETWGMPD